MRVVFFGTPDFAVATLDAIYHASYEIVGVVTAPDKPAGRGLKMQSSDIKKYAEEKRISVLQPITLKDPEFVKRLQQWRADVFVVVAFRFLPFEVYNIPPCGTFNVHASLLPQYRGAAPIHWAIINGETKTGITTFFLNNEIDFGDIILQKGIDILPDETTGELYARMKKISAMMALETLSLIKNRSATRLPQCRIKDANMKLAPKIKKIDTIIDWNDTAKNIINKIRGLSPFPGAVTFLVQKDKKHVSIKIYKASITFEKSNNEVGIIDTDDKTFLYISTKDFKISIHNLQIEGKKRCNLAVFLQGNKASNYSILK
ncbi:MAG: methionyl-tRNA formyltransferase [Bacteroidales bacterium]|jgi:methionyl-tRNA formyltransferase|nr:methionyl-tRNA formyltransferase [Bacteroidales bacterium]